MSAILAGIGWDMVGAASAATFYLPISKVKRWSWETTWAVAGLFSWILLPVAVSVWLLPHFFQFYAALDPATVLTTAAFGCMWGVGNVNFGLAMRYLGMSLGIGVVLGITMVVGTLVPPIVHGQGSTLLTTSRGLLTLAGVLVALGGVILVAYAGQLKEKQLGSAARQFNVKKGLLVALMSGILSSGMSFAIDAAAPISTSALQAGVPSLYSGLPAYVIIMLGGALPNFIYCFWRLARRPELSIRADLAQSLGALARNSAMAVAGGTMWYLQFFFFAWGKASIPQDLAYVNWMLLMSGSVLCGGVVGLAAGEWSKATGRPTRVLWLGMLAIIVAANLVGLGMAI